MQQPNGRTVTPIVSVQQSWWWPPDREIIRLRFGLDIVRSGPRRRGFSYEDYCFEQLGNHRDWSFLIGPGIVNTVLERHPVFAALIKPDYLQICLYGSLWVLTGVIECRSGMQMDVERKIGKLPTFLACLRHHFRLFPEAIRQLTADFSHASEARRLLVPREQEIAVTYVTTVPRRLELPGNNPFPFRQLVIPFRGH